MRNIKKLSKKYNLSNKLSNKLLINKIKKLEILHKKAKKLNIKITKKNKKKQRIYKTDKQLVKEIKMKKNKFGVDDKPQKAKFIDLYKYKTIKKGVGKDVNSLLNLTAMNLLKQGITPDILVNAGYPREIILTLHNNAREMANREVDWLMGD